MKELIGLSREELAEEVALLGQPSFRAKQLWQWLYFFGETDFDKMTNLPKVLREKLKENYTATHPKIISEQISSDGTRKWLMEFADKSRVETVYIPESDRGAVCISSQVGCAQGCQFCHTGTQKCQRNLTAGEIVGQVMAARDACQEWPTKTDENRLLSNIVFMGMGEPLYNFDSVKKAILILNDSAGMEFSKRKITVSTSGRADKIPLLSELGVKLAVSLHAPNDEIRNKIMPINRKFPLEKLMAACRTYQQKSDRRSFITMEYVMLKGINDSLECAQELIQLVKGLEVKFNLIPFHPWAGCSFECSSPQTIKQFSEYLEKHFFAAPVRRSRGEDIMAACGQLKTAYQNNSNENT